MLSGSLEVTVGEERQILRAGDAWYFESALPQSLSQYGRRALRLHQRLLPTNILKDTSIRVFMQSNGEGLRTHLRQKALSPD